MKLEVFFSLFVITEITTVIYSQAATLNDTDRLFNDVIYNNNHRYRPVRNQISPITVQFAVDLLYLERINEVRESVTLNLLFFIEWTDEIRTWNPVDYGGLKVIAPDPLDMWRPRFMLGNSLKTRDMFEDRYAPFHLRYDGRTSWSPGGLYAISCGMKIKYFPFDSQTCILVVGPQDSVQDIQVNISSPIIGMSSFLEDGEWKVVETSCYPEYYIHEGAVFNALVHISITFERRPNYIVVYLIIPVMTLSLLSHIVFLVPRDSGERVGLSMSIMLSLTVYISQVSNSLPRNSNFMSILIIYLIALFIHCSIVVVANCIILIKHHSSQPPQNYNDAEIRSPTCSKDKNSNKDKYLDDKQHSNFARQFTDEFPPTLIQSSDNSDQSPSSSTIKLLPPNKVKVTRHQVVYLDDLILKLTRKSPAIVSSCLSPLMTFIKPLDFLFFVTANLVWLVVTCIFVVMVTTGNA